MVDTTAEQSQKELVDFKLLTYKDINILSNNKNYKLTSNIF